MNNIFCETFFDFIQGKNNIEILLQLLMIESNLLWFKREKTRIEDNGMENYRNVHPDAFTRIRTYIHRTLQ